MLSFPIDPMLAASASTLPGPADLSGGTQYELKADGYRLLAFVDAEGRARLQSRNGADLTAAFPEITDAVADQVSRSSVVDGELVIWGEGGLDFGALQRRMGATRRARALADQAPASLLLFDVLALNGTDLTSAPLAERSDRLDALCSRLHPPLQRMPHTLDPQTAQQWMTDHAHARTGIEGIVAKGRATRYRPGQRGWTKVRIRETAEVIVGAVTGTLSAPTRLVFGYEGFTASGRAALRVAGATTPLNAAQRAALAPFLRAPAGRHPWPRQVPASWLGLAGGKDMPVMLVEPDLVVEVDADTAFERGRWRHPLPFVRVRLDRDAASVTGPA